MTKDVLGLVLLLIIFLSYMYINYLKNTIFIRILAAATINFSLAGVQLLIEGGF